MEIEVGKNRVRGKDGKIGKEKSKKRREGLEEERMDGSRGVREGEGKQNKQITERVEV